MVRKVVGRTALQAMEAAWKYTEKGVDPIEELLNSVWHLSKTSTSS